MHRLYYILFLLTVLGINACGERVDLSDGTESKELYLEASIRPNSWPRATLRTTELYNAQGQKVIIAEGDQARIVLTDGFNVSAEFVYEKDGEYVIPDASFITEGMNYEIKASLNGYPEYEEVTSVVTVPTADLIEEIIQNDLKTEIVVTNEGESLKHTYDIDIKINPALGQDFYMVEPRALLHGRNALTGEYFLRNAEREYFADFYGANATSNDIHAAEHLHGVMINLAEVSNNTINLIFSSTIVLQENVDYLPFIDFYIHTLSDSYYKYNLAKSRQLKSLETGGAQPVISYSNIESGRGAFTALSTTISEFTVTQ